MKGKVFRYLATALAEPTLLNVHSPRRLQAMIVHPGLAATPALLAGCTCTFNFIFSFQAAVGVVAAVAQLSAADRAVADLTAVHVHLLE